ncbi:MAG TPA: hypothetical protein VIY90_16555 [Steroidobacteraceae bacterium]
MQIKITKRGRRNEMRCVRPDGSHEVANLGPGLPHHDLAHFVIERRWRLREGFFGNIAGGYSFAQLSDKDVIKKLGAQSAQAEVLARALGLRFTGASTAEQFAELVNSELGQWHWPTVPVSPAMVQGAAEEFEQLLAQFKNLGDGASLELQFEVSPLSPAHRA